MANIRVALLWHMHQPFYKDLVTGEYRLPWVRMHALKDYCGMVKLLEEFPSAHQTFNLVPSLMTQIQDYAAGTASDPFLSVVSKPAEELSSPERRFALQYLFQANIDRMVRRYPRYAELWEQANSPEKVDVAEKRFSAQEFRDLQVLSQLCWFDEFFLAEPEIAEFVHKGRDYTLSEQQRIVALERELIGRLLPEYAAAAKRGSIEISVSPFYHPILPLLCDTNMGRASCPGIQLPQRFQHAEDAREQLRRGIELQEQIFGVRPRGAWPSEGSVSEEVLKIGSDMGLHWMATDEGVLGRSTGGYFHRDADCKLQQSDAERLYRVYRFERDGAHMHLLFRDHSLSDLIGFVYSGMGAQEAADHFVRSIRDSAQGVVDAGQDATVSIILDGENAWEHYHESGRDFLRRLYDSIAKAGMEMVTVSEAIEREQNPAPLESLVPGSWINANFNVWIGAPEDNKSWNYLKAARDFYSEHAEQADEAKRNLAFEEILISEGSDWNWWYGPEHHSANDAEFDDLYRKHLSNVYRALDATPPDYLTQPILEVQRPEPQWVPQTSYIHPSIDGDDLRYFDWIGAAVLQADSRDSAMHGHEMLLDGLHCGIDENHLYGRVFLEKAGVSAVDLAIQVESWAPEALQAARKMKLDAAIAEGRIVSWKLSDEKSGENGDAQDTDLALAPQVSYRTVFEFSIPLKKLGARLGGKLRIRATASRNGLPLDVLPAQGSMELLVATEEKLKELA